MIRIYRELNWTVAAASLPISGEAVVAALCLGWTNRNLCWRNFKTGPRTQGAQRIKHKLFHGPFAPIRGYTSAGQVQVYPRGLLPHSGNVLVSGDETKMNHLVENRHPAVVCCARHQYRCRSQDPTATSLVFMTRRERIAIIEVLSRRSPACRRPKNWLSRNTIRSWGEASWVGGIANASGLHIGKYRAEPA